MNDYREPIESGMRSVFDGLLTNVNTCLIGQVSSFNASQMTVDVNIVTKVKRDDGTVEQIPPLKDVPVVFFGSSDWVLFDDIDAGTYCVVIFSQRSIEQWFAAGGIVDPANKRKFSLSDGIAIPGVRPKPNTFTVDSGTIGLRNKTGDVYIKVNKTTGQVNINGNLTIDK